MTTPQPAHSSQATADAGQGGAMGLLLRLRTMGITDADFLKQVEAARHDLFVPVEHYLQAWEPNSLPIPCGQTMPPPDLTARIVEALDIHPSHAVLEIGTGTGYQTAILAQRAKKVRTTDRYQTLLEFARKGLDRLGIANVTFHHADGREGTGGKALFDRIVVDSAYQTVPRGLLGDLASGGVVVTAIGEPGEEQMLVKLTKIGSRFEREDLFPVRLSPLEAGVSKAL
ncbi:MAG: protein-L-isoaspartate(D-aspartate) O-methyltransferase [Pseudomonadota bacterium]